MTATTVSSPTQAIGAAATSVASIQNFGGYIGGITILGAVLLRTLVRSQITLAYLEGTLLSRCRHSER